MSTLQVHITAGPQAGTRLQLNQSPVTFGRAAENTLVLDLAVISRQHGELVLNEDGQWVLINHSANVTRVGRKKAAKKPVPLADGVSINIGDTEVFRVHLTPTANEPDAALSGSPTAYEDEPAPQPTERAAGAGLKGRSKLWIGIGIWIGLLILGAAALKLGLDDGADAPKTSGIWIPGSNMTDLQGPEAGRVAVKRLLGEPLPTEDPNASLYDKHITDARRASDGGNRSLFETYSSYQLAISYAQDPNNALESLDQIKYDNALTELAEVIHDGYINGYLLYTEGDYGNATYQMDAIIRDYYPGPYRADDKLADHITRLRNAAQDRTR